MTEERMSGIGHATLEITRALEEHPDYGKKFEVFLVAGYDKIGQLKRHEFKKVSYKPLPLPIRVVNLLWKYHLLPPMDLYVGKGTYIFPNYKNWFLLRSKSITYVHDISFALYPQYVAPKNQEFLIKNMPTWLKRTSLIAADSKSAKKEIMDYYGIADSKVKVLYHAVDKRVFYRRSRAEVASVKSKYDIKGDYIFYLGNIEPRKNIERMVDAYSMLSPAMQKKYSLVIAGGAGWLNEAILAKIQQAQDKGLNILKVKKFVIDEDLPALYSGATLLFHPALYEGFGLSILQAMACGTPVVVGNNSSMPEIAGSGGLLVDAEDSENMAQALEKCLSDKKLRNDLSSNGIAQAKTFEWSNTADQLVSYTIKH